MKHRLRARTPNRTVRDEMAILERLGFIYLGTNAGGHHLFRHPQHGLLRPMSSTPKNDRTWRRTHRAEVAARMGLNLFQFERLVAGQRLDRVFPSSPRRHARKPRRPRTPVGLRMATPPRTRPVAPPRPAQTSCIDCGRPWLSDLDYTTRPCPACGGLVVGGRDAA